MKEFETDITGSLKILQEGGVILYPTDTIWGIGCDATNEEAVAKIFRIKKRSDQKSMIVLLAEEKDITRYTTNPEPQLFEAAKTFQKPVTIIFEGAVHLAKNLINSDGTIAIRVVKETFCHQLIKKLGKPIVSTSANISGFPAPAFFGEISNDIKMQVDYIVHNRQNDTSPSQPSAIIKGNKDGGYTIIRN